MNAKQTAAHRMGASVSNVMETITTANAFPALGAKNVRLKTHLANASAYSAAQSVPITGRTSERNRAFKAASLAAAAIAGAVLSYARAHRLDDLAAKVDLTRTVLQAGRLLRRVELLQQVHDAAAGVRPELGDYGVTEAMLTDLQTQISRLLPLLPVVRDNIVARRVMTEKLEVEIRDMRRFLAEEVDPLVEQLRTSSPDHYALYHAARMIVDSPQASREPSAAPAPTVATVPIPHTA